MAFTYQQWKKLESEQRIINALNDGDKSFGELLEATELSKPILSKRLKSLTKEGKIEIVPEKKTKRFLYHLVYEYLNNMQKSLVVVHGLSKYVVVSLAKSAKDSTISNKEYANKFEKGVLMLFTLRIYALNVAPKLVQQEWLKNTLGLEFVRMMPQLLPENRPELLRYILDGLSAKEQAIYESKDEKEASNRLLEHLETLVEMLPKK